MIRGSRRQSLGHPINVLLPTLNRSFAVLLHHLLDPLPHMGPLAATVRAHRHIVSAVQLVACRREQALQEVGERPCRPSRITLGSPAPDHEGVVPLAHCLATSRAASAHTSPRAETTCCHARRSRGFCNLSSKAGSRIHGPGPMVVAHANTASAGNVRAAARDEGAPPPSLRPQDGQSMCSAHMAMHARGPGAADVAAAAVAIASTGGAGPRMRSTERRRRGGAV